MFPLNERAWKILHSSLTESDELGWSWQKTKHGTTLVDAGCQVNGSLAAGLRMAEICMSGLGQARLSFHEFCGFTIPCIDVYSSQPVPGCLVSQAAHWQVDTGSYQAMGSGPACVLSRDCEAAQEYGWHEEGRHAVLVLEADRLPDEDTCCTLAESCSVSADGLAIIVAPTASLAGSAQIAARSLETALHKIHQLAFDLTYIIDGAGRCPLAPPAGDNLIALGKTNDVIMFGAQIWLSVRGPAGNTLAELVQKVPASTSPQYGQPFLQALEAAGGFYNLDPGLFAPAEITFSNILDGQILHAGCVNSAALKSVLGLEP